jgi:exonuclease VII small subunit
MTSPTQELEDALRAFNVAEAYFEQAYLTYRLARKHLAEAEAAIDVARKKLDPLAETAYLD